MKQLAADFQLELEGACRGKMLTRKVLDSMLKRRDALPEGLILDERVKDLVIEMLCEGKVLEFLEHSRKYRVCRDFQDPLMQLAY